MKILAINGSHRKGNTEFILNRILNSAKENSAYTEVIYLRDKKIDLCSEDDYDSEDTESCRDDMVEVYPKLENADVVILGSPCYFSNVSALMKNFMDRCNPYYFNKKLKNKKFFLVSVGGYEPSIKEAIRCMKNFLKGIYAKDIGSYYAVADKKGELEKNQKVIKELEEIGVRLR